jgi:Phage integrase, N-terminal SAM-like domain
VRVTGLARGLSQGLARWRAPRVVYDPGKIVADLAAALALGGDCLADIAVLREQPALAGPVPSDPVVSGRSARWPGASRRRCGRSGLRGRRPGSGHGRWRGTPEECLRAFEASQVARGFSELTIGNGAGTLARFLVACGRPAWEVTREDVDRVVGELAAQGLAASTRRLYVQVFKNFHAFLVAQGRRYRGGVRDPAGRPGG